MEDVEGGLGVVSFDARCTLGSSRKEHCLDVQEACKNLVAPGCPNQSAPVRLFWRFGGGDAERSLTAKLPSSQRQ